MSPLLDIEIEIYMCERIAVLPSLQWIKEMNKKNLQSNVQTTHLNILLKLPNALSLKQKQYL